MACPISIGDAQQIVHWGVEIYRKIQEQKGVIREAGVMLEELDDYLGWLRKLVTAKSAVANQLDPNWSELMDRITKRMGQIKKVSKGILGILKIYLDNGSLSEYLFPFGRNPKIMKNLMEDLQRHENALYKELWSASLISDQSVAGAGAGGAATTPPIIARPLPTPSPKPAKKDCGIIYVDPHNQGRGKVAEAYTKLLREWTVRTGGQWPVKYAHSAGLRIRNRSNCVATLEALKPSFTIAAGNLPPVSTAMDSMFDNKFFDHSWKAGIKDSMSKSTSRGINTNLFQSYDYILVFMQREFTRLLALKKALIAAHGAQIAPKNKGRIVHLGAYISKDGNAQSITDAKKGEGGKESRQEWNKTAGEIKLAIRAFLKDELEWSLHLQGISTIPAGLDSGLRRGLHQGMRSQPAGIAEIVSKCSLLSLSDNS